MPQKTSKRSAPWAVVLLSGGLDSATAAAWAQARGFRVAALTVRYGQRHAAELAAARRIARSLKLEKHLEIGVELSRIGGSALTDLNLKVPKNRSAKAISTGIPITYVPARNTVFLSLALGLAETLGAQDLVLGVNVLDYSGYPDCRPEFVRAFRRLADLATKAGVEKTARFKIHTPLIRKTKAQIVRLGTRLGVDYALTTSCYAPVTRGKRVFACGRCDSCHLRLKGFAEAGRTDPVPYGPHP